ncbi:MAG: 1,4-beta-xylanase, partial [Proteobacteria bacterium]
MKIFRWSFMLSLLCFQFALNSFAAKVQWTSDASRAWSEKQPWQVGANYIPAYAVNQLEMWQADT